MPNNRNNDNKYNAQNRDMNNVDNIEGVDNLNNEFVDDNIGTDPYSSRGNKKDKSSSKEKSRDNDGYKSNSNTKDNNDSSKKAVKTGAKAAANYFAPGVGGKVVDAAAKTKLGDKVLNKGAEVLNKTPGMAKATKKLDDAGALDAADKATDIAGGGKNGTPTANNNSAIENGIGNSDFNGSDTPGFSKLPGFPGRKKKNNSGNSGEEQPADITGKFFGNMALKIAILSVVSGLGLVFMILLVTLIVSGTISDYSDAAGISQLTGEETGGLNYSPSTEEEKDFFDRVLSVKNSFQASGKTVDPLKLVATYHIINRHNSKYDYEYMTTDKLTSIANAMFSGNSYSEDTFRQNLKNNVFPSYFPLYSDKRLDKLVDEVFEYIENYYKLIGKGNTACGPLGTCTYEIKGFWISDRGNVTANMTITDLQIELLDCGGRYGGTWGQLLSDEEPVPFEKYILGVAYQEIGPDAPDEAIKAQMIAARSYILSRPTAMGNAQGRMLQELNGKWTLRTASCTADQVYCDPDQGCSANSGGGQWGVVHSGTSYPVSMKPIMSEDHKMRTLASEVQGEVLVNAQGYIINSGYVQTEQNKFSSLANSGLDYKQILMQVYNGDPRSYGASDIEKMSCNDGGGRGCGSSSSPSTGEYASWLQGGQSWSGISLGNSSHNIGSAGCLVTSVAMLIAKSGVDTTVDGDFNPGSFVKKMNSSGGFSGANFVWAAVSNAAPNFNFVGKKYISGYAKSQKLSEIKSLLDQGYYVVAEVKGNTGQHWVAIDSVNGDTVNMMDPASQSTNLWAQYDWNNTSELAYFRAS